MTDSLTNAALAGHIDHTLLSPTATPEDVVRHTEEALSLGVCAICVSPSMLPHVPRDHGGLEIATVCGFPSGKHLPWLKAAEASAAVAHGADEIDMVIDIAAAADGHYDLVETEIRVVREAVPAPTVLKVIMESAVLSTSQIAEVTRAAVRAEADFVKTSTGFHPAGGASLDAVRTMVEAGEGRILVKASGGIRTREDAEAYLAAGADRLGVSATAVILE
ncbi:deoxyribose-phosphate aldolase [Corynebacterium variabile]|uniref:deoxyribose-phosphate aldolase n=1 Tax=Corynebacterium variabile TaxID=1727 RepID=UPI003FCF759C